MYIGKKNEVHEKGFRRMGNRYASLIDRDHFLGLDPFEDSKLSTKNYVPSANVMVNEDFFTLEIALPGFKKEEITLSTTDNVLSISGQKNWDQNQPLGEFIRKEHLVDSFERSFELSPDVDLNKIEATFCDGMLYVKLYRLEKNKPAARKVISIQ